jgi:hypothetical protein
MEKMGFSIVISLWVPSHLYITSDSPHTIIPAVPAAYQTGDTIRLHTPDLPGQICTLLTTDHAFGGLVTLDFKLDSEKKQMQATLVNVERVFNMGDEV